MRKHFDQILEGQCYFDTAKSITHHFTSKNNIILLKNNILLIKVSVKWK